MKILKLDLHAFGPFTDLSLELDAGHEGLHLVYGPNEAGKTTALRALRQLLFGIPHNSRDNFVHAYPNLRIGATLQAADEKILECIRRKGSKKPEVVHTLNGTAVSNARAILALLETHQRADGSISIPKALVPYMGRDRIGGDAGNGA